jgi:hypothetical protein
MSEYTVRIAKPSINHAWQQGWAYLRERWPEAFKNFEPPSMARRGDK